MSEERPMLPPGAQAAAPAEQPVPQIHHYRLSTLNGLVVDFTSTHDLVTLWSLIVRDGWAVTPEDFIPYHALAHLKLLPPPKPDNGPRVVPFFNRS